MHDVQQRRQRSNYMASVSYNGFSPEYRSQVGGVVYGRIRTGEWPSPSRCEICGTRERRFLQAHLEDYDEPTSYIGICRRCHLTLHRRFSRPQEWLDLLDSIDIDASNRPNLFGESGHQVPDWVRRLALHPINLRELKRNAAAQQRERGSHHAQPTPGEPPSG